MSWQSAIERTVQGLGYDLVDVARTAGGLLRVTIDRVPGHAYASGGDHVTVDDCELVTRQLQYLLEVEAVDYQRLEVSSPGLDRPLRKPADWERFVGCAVEITLRAPFQGRRRWSGQLVGREGGYSLLLPADEPAGKAGKAGKAAERGRPAGAKASKGRRPVEAPEAAPRQGLDFSLDEVREARLVPVIDFKRRRASEDAAAPQEGGPNP